VVDLINGVAEVSKGGGVETTFSKKKKILSPEREVHWKENGGGAQCGHTVARKGPQPDSLPSWRETGSGRNKRKGTNIRAGN